jgi:hypothetical protein
LFFKTYYVTKGGENLFNGIYNLKSELKRKCCVRNVWINIFKGLFFAGIGGLIFVIIGTFADEFGSSSSALTQFLPFILPAAFALLTGIAWLYQSIHVKCECDCLESTKRCGRGASSGNGCCEDAPEPLPIILMEARPECKQKPSFKYEPKLSLQPRVSCGRPTYTCDQYPVYGCSSNAQPGTWGCQPNCVLSNGQGNQGGQNSTATCNCFHG